jgi:hypothetical protein
MRDFVRRRPVLSTLVAVLLVLTVLSVALPYVGGGGHGIGP